MRYAITCMLAILGFPLSRVQEQIDFDLVSTNLASFVNKFKKDDNGN